MTGAAVTWSGVSVTLGARPVLIDVNLAVEAGSWLGLLGPNGAGKTTLLRTLAGAVSHEGAVSLAGAAEGLSARQRAQHVAFVPQLPVIPPGVRVFDYVLLGRTPYQGLRFAPSRDDRRRTWTVVKRLDLVPFVDRSVETLSGGERQRVILGRALVQDTPVLVLDEPTAFLDAGHQLDVLELIEDLRAEREITVITTLHDLAVAGQFADRLAILAEGRIVSEGAPVDVLTAQTIKRHWGVDATITVDPRGSVTLAIHRRRSRRTS